MKSKGLSERITILMNTEMMDGLKKLAEAKFSDPSKIIRRLIAKAINGSKQVKQ